MTYRARLFAGLVAAATCGWQTPAQISYLRASQSTVSNRSRIVRAVRVVRVEDAHVEEIDHLRAPKLHLDQAGDGGSHQTEFAVTTVFSWKPPVENSVSIEASAPHDPFFREILTQATRGPPVLLYPIRLT